MPRMSRMCKTDAQNVQNWHIFIVTLLLMKNSILGSLINATFSSVKSALGMCNHYYCLKNELTTSKGLPAGLHSLLGDLTIHKCKIKINNEQNLQALSGAQQWFQKCHVREPRTQTIPITSGVSPRWEWCKDHSRWSWNRYSDLGTTCVIWNAPVHYTQGDAVCVMQVQSTRLAIHAYINYQFNTFTAAWVNGGSQQLFSLCSCARISCSAKAKFFSRNQRREKILIVSDPTWHGAIARHLAGTSKENDSLLTHRWVMMHQGNMTSDPLVGHDTRESRLQKMLPQCTP